MVTANHELVLRQLTHQVVTQPTPLWPDNDLRYLDPSTVPEEIILATSSYRKIALVLLQLAVIERNPIAPVFEPFFENGEYLELLEFLKRTFSNANGASKESFDLGFFDGVPFRARPSNGETQPNVDPTSQRSAAIGKAKWLAELDSDLPGNRLYIGADTMDELYIPGEDRIPLTKPSTLFWFLTDPENNFYAESGVNTAVIQERLESETLTPSERRALWFFPEPHILKDMTDFADWYQNVFLPVGAELRGVTAVAVVNQAGEVVSVLTSTLSMPIEEDRLQSAKEHFDTDASGGGQLQRLGELTNNNHFFPVPEIKNRDDEEKIKGFLVLCQILGVPLWILKGAVYTALDPDNELETTHHAVPVSA